MKKIIAILIVALFAIYANAAAPTYAAVDANYRISKEVTISSSAGYDTLSGDDSLTILTKWRPNGDLYQYILVTSTITGGSSTDSMNMRILIDSYDKDGNFLYQTIIDSIGHASPTGKAILLPIGSTVIGDYYNIKLKQVTAAGQGGQAILNRIYIYGRRLVTNDR